jgi:hypothetical protein
LRRAGITDIIIIVVVVVVVIIIIIIIIIRDSSVGIALSYRLDDWDSRFRFPAGARKFSLHHRVQNGSPMGTRSFPWG